MCWLEFGLLCVLILPSLNVVSLEIYKGNFNYSTYYEGNSPIIILSQHGGSIKPDNDTIPDRRPGCWNGTDCLWYHDCQSTTPFARDSTNCGVKTTRDSYTKEFAQCLRETLTLNISGSVLYPHLVVNELHRSKLDANREYGEATLNNSIAGNTWNEIHYLWMTIAKNATIEQYNWGLVLDIHGQSVNIYNQLGYLINQEQLLYSDNLLNDEIDSTSIRSLATKWFGDVSSIIRGNNSLGNYLNQTYGDYVMVPSLKQPNLGDEDVNGLHYYQGGFGLETHGSQHGGVVDALQIEINRDNRWEQDLRQQFCQDFSQSIIAFVYKWYNISNDKSTNNTSTNEAASNATDQQLPQTTTTATTTDHDVHDNSTIISPPVLIPLLIICVCIFL